MEEKKKSNFVWMTSSIGLRSEERDALPEALINSFPLPISVPTTNLAISIGSWNRILEKFLSRKINTNYLILFELKYRQLHRWIIDRLIIHRTRFNHDRDSQTIVRWIPGKRYFILREICFISFQLTWRMNHDNYFMQTWWFNTPKLSNNTMNTNNVHVQERNNSVSSIEKVQCIFIVI